MARTIVGSGDPKAISKFSAALSVLAIKKAFFGKGMMTRGEESKGFIQRQDDLKKEKGDEILVDLLMPAKMEPVIGSDVLSGNEEEMIFYTDRVKIQNVRFGTSLGDTMTRKRTIYDLRKEALRLHADWWSRAWDEIIFIMASGVMPVNNGFLWQAGNKMFQTNALRAPDSKHQFFGGAATSTASIVAGDKMSLALVNKLVARAETMGGDASNELSMVPSEIGGEDAYCLLMHPFQAYDLRLSTATGEWMDIQKAAVTHEGKDNPIFKGSSSLGMYNGVVLKKHRNVIQFAAGAGGAVNAGRALFMARQGVLITSGNAGNDMSFKITEEEKDHGDKLAVGSSCIFGVQKSQYNVNEVGARDFGVFAVDTSNIEPV
jgi:N4-gp56 family major capsid protein